MSGSGLEGMMTARLLALVAGFLVATVVGGWGRELPPATADQPLVAGAVRALADGRADAGRFLPADFATVMGYVPVGGATGPLRPDGGCSSPFGGTRYGFDAACRQHDLGYDLLRYARLTGHPLGGWARRAVDDRFTATMLARCDGPGCRATAVAYTAAIRFNSWRQGYGTPLVESPSQVAAPAVAGAGVALLLGLLPVPRRRTARTGNRS